MTKYDFAVWVVDEGFASDEVDGGTARFVRVVDHGLREGRIHKACVDKVGRVDEDDCFAPGELCPDRFQGRMPEVEMPFAISGVQSDAVGMQLVEGIGDFRQGGGDVIEDGGKRGEESKQ